EIGVERLEPAAVREPLLLADGTHELEPARHVREREVHVRVAEPEPSADDAARPSGDEPAIDRVLQLGARVELRLGVARALVLEVEEELTVPRKAERRKRRSLEVALEQLGSARRGD